MNTWRVGAALGWGLALAMAAGCSSAAHRNDGGADGRDFGFGRDTNSSQPCTYKGVTYRVGETFTYNCVRFTCEGGNNVIQVGGAPCSDGGRDARPRTDLPVGSEVAPADAADAGRDATPVEVGRQDVTPPFDVQAVDLTGDEDTSPPEDHTSSKRDGLPTEEDTAPPPADLGTADVAPPVQCIYGGQKYGVGVSFPCECSTCKCDDTGTVVLVTELECPADAE